VFDLQYFVNISKHSEDGKKLLKYLVFSEKSYTFALAKGKTKALCKRSLKGKQKARHGCNRAGRREANAPRASIRTPQN